MKLQEIARLAGVSPATVSRVFSHHPNIRNEVREHVFGIAKAKGYHPRLSSKQRNVVIILPGDAIYPIRNCLEMAMMALTLELPKRNFRLEILPQDNLERLDSIQFCGAVAIGAEPDDFKKWSERFPVPLILIDRDLPASSSNIYSIRSDENQGMDIAIVHLYERGHRKIGCIIHGKAGQGNADARYAAIVNALKKRGLDSNESLIYLSNDDNYVEIIGKLLKQKVDALFCPGGNAGIISAYALSLFNKRVPDDISLITSEYKMFSRYAVPPQTTITQDHITLAKTAADAIEAHIKGPKFPQQSVFPYSLIVRDSVTYLKN
ncbi:MAG: transcriptional regulator [Lentisphaerae bacterium GWF2_44_16]|nr:MAG: transcriptional regulator [Lentisphaerae bacterium GWF2_44_16]